MRRIHDSTLYEAEELKAILNGFISLESLRGYGLVGLPGKGYWGRDVIDAITAFQVNRKTERGFLSERENVHGEISKKDRTGHDRLVRAAAAGELEVEGQRRPRPKRARVLPVERDERSVESQRDKFERLANPEAL